jgi:hypothetical protein
VRKFAFVPTRPGTLTIPGISVHWWDTAHDRMETAELPAHTLNVLPAAGIKGSGSAPAAASQADAQPGSVNAPAVAATAQVPVSTPTSLRTWQALAALGFLLWLITLGSWWRSRRMAPVVAAGASPYASPGASAQRAAFLRACSLGELAGAERALVAWARSERADVRNLGELAGRLTDATQREALSALQRARYAGASTHGVGTQLERAFKAGLAWPDAAQQLRDKSPLPALYPE